jgi:thioredoxin reductase/NAD-dependent dihydropyrimidine dehydrogenase PreA subunit
MLRWLIGRPDEDEVRLPVLGRHYESSLPGLYIVGDLAGAPTIRVAANQGHELMRHIAALPDGKAEPGSAVHDVVIVGAGSSGLAAALEAKECGLDAVLLEAGQPASTIREFPRRKEIYAEPKSIPSVGGLWIEDCRKEKLLEKWDAQLAGAGLDIHSGDEVTDIRRVRGAFEVLTASGKVHRGRRVALATGKRGNPRKLGVPGEDRAKVAHRLYDPEDHDGERVLVVGGGDSAVEAAVQLAEVAEVTLCYRRDGFFRLKTKNREKIDAAIASGRVRTFFESGVREIGEETVVLETRDGARTIGNDRVIVAIGAELPHAFFRKIGVRMEKQWSPAKAAALLAVTALFWLLYSAKHYPPLFPWDALGFSFEDFGFGPLHWWQVFTLLYTAVILVWGIRAYRRYSFSRLQRAKYLTILAVQTVLLCVLPLFVVPALAPDWYHGYAWHWVLAWPLSVSAIPAPWTDGHMFPFVYAIILTFLVFPIAVYFFGSRFCSFVCGCGCMAETLGDRHRNKAPRGPKSIRFERLAGRVVLGLATAATLWLVFRVNWGAGKAAARSGNHGLALYGIWIDVLLAGAVGLGFYWFMGNRVWCRFFCPLRMYMNLLGRIASRFRIVPSPDKCIACGQCSRECQMGIPVMDFAKAGRAVTLANSSCIGCGICVDVCPVDVLHYSEKAALKAAPSKVKESVGRSD